jgi:TolA-binding protein
MKNVIIILALMFSIGIPAYATEQAERQTVDIVVKKENKSIFKGLLYKVWGRLRALNPQLKTNKTRSRSVATMGIRGSETTSSIIEPYWKGDKTDDKNYVAELTRYTTAQQYAEDGDLQKAVTALNSFLEDYNDSELKPNAQFALGISQGGLGNIAASKETLQNFVDDNPKHPLVTDAKQVIAEL